MRRERKRKNASARAVGSSGGTRIPVSSRASRFPPTSVATAASPAAIYSSSELENPSARELSTPMSIAARYGKTSVCARPGECDLLYRVAECNRPSEHTGCRHRPSEIAYSVFRALYGQHLQIAGIPLRDEYRKYCLPKSHPRDSQHLPSLRPQVNSGKTSQVDTVIGNVHFSMGHVRS